MSRHIHKNHNKTTSKKYKPKKSKQSAPEITITAKSRRSKPKATPTSNGYCGHCGKPVNTPFCTSCGEAAPTPLVTMN